MKAAGATNVSVDLEGLDCTVCFGPLKPPVFQVIRSNSFFLLPYPRNHHSINQPRLIYRRVVTPGWHAGPDGV
jgi:hypothetical protein